MKNKLYQEIVQIEKCKKKYDIIDKMTRQIEINTLSCVELIFNDFNTTKEKVHCVVNGKHGEFPFIEYLKTLKNVLSFSYIHIDNKDSLIILFFKTPALQASALSTIKQKLLYDSKKRMNKTEFNNYSQDMIEDLIANKYPEESNHIISLVSKDMIKEIYGDNYFDDDSD